MLNAAPQSSAWRAWLLVVAAMWAAFAPAWAASASFAPPPSSPAAYQAKGYEAASSRACARGQNSHLGFLAENVRFDAPRTSATTETATGSEAAAAKTASGVCIYLYAHADPVNGTDPSGYMTMVDLLSGMGPQGNLRSIKDGAALALRKEVRQSTEDFVNTFSLTERYA